MFRSAYVIGLGGTGQWILTYLKKELLEINQGAMPENVKLLGVDTQIAEVAVAASNASLVNDARKNAMTDARLGDVRLDKRTEFLQIGKPLFDFIQDIHLDRQKPDAKQEYRYLDWLDSERLLNLGRDSCDTTYGAGAFPQLGRLSLFKSVSDIYNKIRTDLDALKRFVTDGNESQQLEIHIASSIAGGTGAGILIDTAWLVRAAAKQLGFQNYVLRSFIVLPTAFDVAGISTDKRLRSFAVWSQLDRFMISQIAVKGNTKIVFNPNTNPPIEIECNEPVFGTTYFVDPNRDVNPIAPPPENGTFPSVAQTISFILDKESGAHYAAHVPNVKVGGALQLPPGVYHSAIGSYTIKVPVYRARAKFSRELAFAAFEKISQPQISDTGIGIGLRSDRNRENPQNPENEVSQFLKSDQQTGTGGQEIRCTVFGSHIEEVYQKTKAGPKSLSEYTLNESNSAVDRRGNTLVNFVDRIPLTSNEDPLPRQITDLRRMNVWDVVRPSRDLGTTPVQNYPNVVAGVKNYDVSWFGQKTIQQVKDQAVTVRSTEGDRTKTLREIKSRQISTYKAVLAAWTERMLNGIHQDAIIAKEGKLGYVQACYGELIVRFNSYSSYLISLKQQIGNNKTFTARERNHESALKSYDTLKAKTCIFCFFDQNVHPRAREAEREYLRKVQKIYDYYLAEQVINISAETIQEMLDFTQRAKQRIDKWMERLVTGRNTGDRNTDFTGLYNYMRDRILENRNDLAAELKQGNPDFAQNKNLRGVLQIIQPQIAQTAYQNNPRWQDGGKFTEFKDDDNIREILEKFSWKVQLNPAGELDLACGLSDEENHSQIIWMDESESQEKVSTNYSLWLRKSQKPFVNMSADHPADLEIPKEFPIAQNLADEIIDWAKPMYQPKSNQTGAYDKVVFVRIDDHNNRVYMDTFRDRLKHISAGSGGWLLNPNVPADQSNSQDPFKLSLIRAEHLMPTKDFALWNRMHELFTKTIASPGTAADPTINFIYTAEKNAIALAIKKPGLIKKNFEPFDPEIVSLLEDQEKTLMFFLAHAHGILKRTKASGANSFEWICNGVYLYKPGDSLREARPPSIFDILRYWLGGKDIDARKVEKINFDDVRVSIRKKEDEGIEKSTKGKPVKSRAIKVYQDAISAIHDIIDKDTEVQRSLLNERESRYFQSDKYNDLKDLAEIFYRERINHLDAGE
ncbi:MAG: tubulin-like doman-containing protein [Methylococcales bacterium]|nr:tubulin-like doman-containing protein [Methylococcales bacterium]